MEQKEVRWLLKEKYDNKPTAQFKKDVARLKAGEPVDYVIGFTYFLGCKIDLSKKPLIPRPETEFWVEQAINTLSCDFKSFHKRKIKVLDMFAGSGCIGLAVLKHIKNSRIDFADIDNRMVGQKVIKSDVFSNIKGRYDFIFANPPYIPTTKRRRIQKSVLKYEPKQALFGGKDGLFYIRKFLSQVKNYLRRPASANASARQSKIFMEFSPEQKKEIGKLLKKYGYKNHEFHRDQYRRWRWVVIR